MHFVSPPEKDGLYPASGPEKGSVETRGSTIIQYLWVCQKSDLSYINVLPTGSMKLIIVALEDRKDGPAYYFLREHSKKG